MVSSLVSIFIVHTPCKFGLTCPNMLFVFLMVLINISVQEYQKIIWEKSKNYRAHFWKNFRKFGKILKSQ